jgi:hypothetical protein
MAQLTGIALMLTALAGAGLNPSVQYRAYRRDSRRLVYSAGCRLASERYFGYFKCIGSTLRLADLMKEYSQ